MTERQRDVLVHLRYCPAHPRQWLRPMDVGGRNGSHHSATLAQLHRLGLAARQERGLGWHYSRPSYMYRITRAGRAALKATR